MCRNIRETETKRERDVFILIMLWTDRSSSMLLYVHEVKRQTKKLDSQIYILYMSR